MLSFPRNPSRHLRVRGRSLPHVYCCTGRWQRKNGVWWPSCASFRGLRGDTASLLLLRTRYQVNSALVLAGRQGRVSQDAGDDSAAERSAALPEAHGASFSHYLASHLSAVRYTGSQNKRGLQLPSLKGILAPPKRPGSGEHQDVCPQGKLIEKISHIHRTFIGP